MVVNVTTKNSSHSAYVLIMGINVDIKSFPTLLIKYSELIEERLATGHVQILLQVYRVISIDVDGDIACERAGPIHINNQVI